MHECVVYPWWEVALILTLLILTIIFTFALGVSAGRNTE